ncbi:MAG TPA: hypothetical protein VFE50_14455 [Cyclobacteriaceae bacterium]|nr:hypothetical protein [Cyclobacteriaceae bacterium]
MRKKAFLRVVMVAVGFIAVCAIVLTPSFSQVKEKKTDSSETVLIQAPTDAIPGSAVKMDQPEIPLLTLIEEQEPKQSYPIIRSVQVAKYLKVLFRTLIAPNAP